MMNLDVVFADHEGYNICMDEAGRLFSECEDQQALEQYQIARTHSGYLVADTLGYLHCQQPMPKTEGLPEPVAENTNLNKIISGSPHVQLVAETFFNVQASKSITLANCLANENTIISKIISGIEPRIPPLDLAQKYLTLFLHGNCLRESPNKLDKEKHFSPEVFLYLGLALSAAKMAENAQEILKKINRLSSSVNGNLDSLNALEKFYLHLGEVIDFCYDQKIDSKEIEAKFNQLIDCINKLKAESHQALPNIYLFMQKFRYFVSKEITIRQNINFCLDRIGKGPVVLATEHYANAIRIQDSLNAITDQESLKDPELQKSLAISRILAEIRKAIAYARKSQDLRLLSGMYDSYNTFLWLNNHREGFLDKYQKGMDLKIKAQHFVGRQKALTLKESLGYFESCLSIARYYEDYIHKNDQEVIATLKFIKEYICKLVANQKYEVRQYLAKTQDALNNFNLKLAIDNLQAISLLVEINPNLAVFFTEDIRLNTLEEAINNLELMIRNAGIGKSRFISRIIDFVIKTVEKEVFLLKNVSRDLCFLLQEIFNNFWQNIEHKEPAMIADLLSILVIKNLKRYNRFSAMLCGLWGVDGVKQKALYKEIEFAVKKLIPTPNPAEVKIVLPVFNMNINNDNNNRLLRTVALSSVSAKTISSPFDEFASESVSLATNDKITEGNEFEQNDEISENDANRDQPRLRRFSTRYM